MIPAQKFTVDASVWIGYLVKVDVHSADSLSFFDRVLVDGNIIVCPTLAYVEVIATLNRVTADVVAVREAGELLRNFPGIVFVPLDWARSERTANVAVSVRLRGADAVYVAVAQEVGSILITWDAEMRNRATNVVKALTPAEWLAQGSP